MIRLVKEQLYQYTVLRHPTEAQAKEGQVTEVIVELSTEQAKSDDVLFRKLLRNIPDKYESELDQIDIVIRPF